MLLYQAMHVFRILQPAHNLKEGITKLGVKGTTDFSKKWQTTPTKKLTQKKMLQWNENNL